MRIATLALVAAFAFLPCLCRAKDSRPNLVLIVTDNQGAWTLGCYGNRDIQTPHIDRLASEGMRFTRAFSPNGVCSPTRASLLTGLMPSQHGVHSYLGANEAQVGPGAYCTIREFKTLPKALSQAGYRCGLVGKWHLGANETPQEGFTSWVTMPHGHTTTFYDASIIDDGKIRNEPTYLTQFWTERAVEFLKEKDERPFFLYLAYNGPYGLGASLNHPARNRFAGVYADEFLPSFPRDGVHPWLHGNKKFVGDETAIRRVAAETSGIDDGVGEIVATLEQLGLTNDTLVVYTADQGWVGGQNGLWGMSDHTRPTAAFDGMMHVPLIVRQPGRVNVGTSDDLVSGYDLMPTLLGELGLSDPEKLNPQSPGLDVSPVLHGESVEGRDAVFFEMETTRVIRTPSWKYIHRPDGPFELYNLKQDPHERVNLYGQPGHDEQIASLKKRLEEFFNMHVDPQYDLYHGGGSKTHLLTQPEKKRIVPRGGK